MEVKVQLNGGRVHTFGTTSVKPCTVLDMVNLLKRTEQWTKDMYTVKINDTITTDLSIPVGEGMLIKVEG
jgi:hypothetical protein